MGRRKLLYSAIKLLWRICKLTETLPPLLKHLLRGQSVCRVREGRWSREVGK